MPRIHDSIKKPTDILSGKGAIGRLYRRARGLMELQQRIREIVPGDIYVAAFEDGAIHLVTPSAALATRLRYQQRRFIGNLALEGKAVTAIRVSVRPELADRYEPEPVERQSMSRETARRIAETAEYIEDEELRKAMIRLSKHSSDS